eukprot:GFUD01013045.1.p1 GENE.GFUD01013045.1~~GFUD01013045.1.p1  ORF type:complete len:653 (-),score=154.82 GFUD01013045.1:165-2123(-)
MLKNNKIQGLKILFFNGQRYMGKKDKSTDEEIIREKDFTVFLEFKDKFYIILMEVKCIEEQNNGHRKKATSQLKDHCKVLKNTHEIQESEIQKIMLHSAWPRLKREYTCNHCNKPHAVYQLPPAGCPRNKGSQPNFEEPGWHLFKENFETQKKFDRWLKHCFTEGKAMEKESWSKILKIHTQHACGALYEELTKKFLLLGMDQLALRDSPKHELNKPKFVPGIAGTGKTITVCAKIEKLFENNELNSENKVMYICFSDSLIDFVRDSLKRLKCKIDLDLIEFRNYKSCTNMMDFFKNEQYQMIFEGKFKYIFLDEAQDLGIKELTKMIEAVIANLKDKKSEYFQMMYPLGHFWILFDVFQSDVETHGISVTGEKRSLLKWEGGYIDQTVFDEGKKMDVILPLKTVFRMTQNILKHILDMKLYPKDIKPKDSGIEGPKVEMKQIVLEQTAGQDDKIQSSMANILLPIIKDVFKRNIHMGEVAILFDNKDIELLMPEESGGIEAIIKSLNSLLKTAFNKQKKLAPEVTGSIDKESILNPHSESILKCRCKMFLGSVEEVKGLTLTMVVYVPFFRSDGNTPLFVEEKKTFLSRTSPYYKAVSRSSCEVQIKEITLSDHLLQKAGIPLNTLPAQHKEAIADYKKGKGKAPLTKLVL